jgi:hypothetical protein
MIWGTITDDLERPIPTPVENLRPARDTCEECHRPERFTGDIIRVHTSYLPDEANTKSVLTRGYRVGGGELETAGDIHWHIAANVWYLNLDKDRQEIAWVGVEDNNGGLTEYIDLQKITELSPQRIEDEKRLMDCMDCHNRATHIFNSPNELINAALIQGKIDSDLPFIKREGLSALDPPNPSLTQAIDKIESIKDFYRISYPQIYEEKELAINAAIEELKEIARLTTFPDMKVTWETYYDNSGHTESPGCFRCHGKLVAPTADQEGKVIDITCNSCHYTITP